jgi:hypothetical protein
MPDFNWGGDQNYIAPKSKSPWGSFWGFGKPGGQATSQEFDFGQMDPQSFDYDKWLGSFYQDIAGTLPTQVGFDITGGQATQGATPETLGYHWDATGQVWERESPGGIPFTRTQEEMDKYLAKQNRGMPGSAMGEAMGLYEADVNRMLEAERGNFLRDLQLRMAGIQTSFEGAADLREQAQSSADILRSRAADLGLEGEAVVERISDWVDTNMMEVQRLGEDAIETAMSAESAFATQLANYSNETAQRMSAYSIGIQRAAAPVHSAITTGMHPDGTPMSKAEQQASYLALNYQTAVQVQHAMAPLVNEREQTLLKGSQFAAQLSQATAATQQQQAALQEQAGAQFGGLLLGAYEQQKAYSGLAEQINMQAENALAAAELQAAQMETAGMFNAAQLRRDFNPVSFLSGFLGMLSVPPEVWQRNFPMDLEFDYA